MLNQSLFFLALDTNRAVSYTFGLQLLPLSPTSISPWFNLDLTTDDKFFYLMHPLQMLLETIDESQLVLFKWNMLTRGSCKWCLFYSKKIIWFWRRFIYDNFNYTLLVDPPFVKLFEHQSITCKYSLKLTLLSNYPCEHFFHILRNNSTPIT